MTCRGVLPMLEPFVDGELPPEKMVEIETHLVECETCMERVRLSEALRASVQRTVRAVAVPSPRLEQRIRAALAAERAREQEQRRPAPHHAAPHLGGPLSWRVVAPLAAAAGLVLVVAGSTNAPSSAARKAPSEAEHAAASAVLDKTIDSVLDDIIDTHVQRSAPDVTEPNLVKQFEPDVGVPVDIPKLQDQGARWEGASVVPVRRSRAAAIRWNYDGKRVTVYVYDPNRVPLRSATNLEPRVVRNTPVFVGTRRGFSIAAVEQRGVGHAIASDLHDSESAELIVASLH